MKGKMYDRIALVGDFLGIPVLLNHVPRDLVKCIIASSVRPQYIPDLSLIASGLKVELLIQPKYGTPEYAAFLERFSSKNINLILCNSYSMILREDLLNMVDFNAVNVHAALLPKNRGCNPIQWSLIHGDLQTGVSIHYMDRLLDSGDLIAQAAIPIEQSDTWVSLVPKLGVVSEKLMAETLPLIVQGTNKRIRQKESGVTQNKRLNADYPKIDFQKMTNEQVFNLIRAQVNPLKGAYLDLPEGRMHFDKWMSPEEVADLRAKYGK